MRPRHASAGWALALIGLLSAPCLALDRNNNQQSDVWEMIYNATGLVAAADADSDGVPNAAESIAGTDPRNAGSFPVLALGTNGVQPAWDGKPGKVYQLLASPSLAPVLWTVLNTTTGSGAELSRVIPTLNATQSLLRISIADLDRDGDQLTDWDEAQLGFDPESQHSERYSNTDSQRVASAISMISTITVSIIDGEMYERWPDAGVIAVRRSGGIRPLTVNLTFGGSATRGTDYTNAPGTNLTISAGRTEAWIECWPVADAANTETTETITVTLAAGSNYVIGAGNSASLNLYNETTSSLPNPKSAGRFLVQAAFGPDADATNDVDMVPENVEEVQVLGFEAWITNQFARPVGRLQPFTEYAATNIPDFYVDAKEAAWWNRAMGVPSLIPGGPAQQPDPLRQRIGFALSQIFVISDRLDAIGNNPAGMAHYYDLLLTNAFGNYRDLLYHVTLHPCMGLYLSHLGNQKPDPINNIYPDENYAREVMQLFSIGLWELHQDGSRKTNALGQWIPTYDNARITQFARVFTGLGFGGTNATSFYAPYDLLAP